MSLSVLDMPGRRAWRWLIVVGLVGLSGSAMVLSVGVLLLVLTALVVPMFALTVYSTLRSPVGRMAASGDHALMVSTVRNRRCLEGNGADVYGWENEGGARREVEIETVER